MKVSFFERRVFKKYGEIITWGSVITSYWDKEKKQPRSKRTLIGRLDTATRTIVPTDGRGKRRTQKEPDPVIRKGPVPTVKTERLFFGATYLLDQVGEETGVTADLKTCFPNHYKQILSIAYYLVLEDQNPLFRFKKWAAIHKHPYGFVLISNEVKDPVTALRLYRMRDVVEKAFWNVKERLNLRRTMASSESSLEGKLFVEFVALIYLSYIQKRMEEKGLFSTYTMHELLDELDVIECLTEPGKAPIQGKVLKSRNRFTGTCTLPRY